MAILVQQHNWVLLKIIIEIVARKAKLFAQKPAFFLLMTELILMTDASMSLQTNNCI